MLNIPIRGKKSLLKLQHRLDFVRRNIIRCVNSPVPLIGYSNLIANNFDTTGHYGFLHAILKTRE